MAQEEGLVRNVAVEECRTGLLGMAGNKGAVAVRMSVGRRLPPEAPLGPTSFCVVVAHLAAHIRNLPQRNQEYRAIMSQIRFNSPPDRPARPTYSQGPGPDSDEWLPADILSHDAAVFMGDLNYRIDGMESPAIKALAAQEEWEELLRHDQLVRERAAGRVLLGFEEPPVDFAPTYKFDRGTDNYDTSAKQRAPAWCDRILVRGPAVQVEAYGSLPGVRASDHKPVAARLRLPYRAAFRHAAYLAAAEAARAAAAAAPRPAWCS